MFHAFPAFLRITITEAIHKKHEIHEKKTNKCACLSGRDIKTLDYPVIGMIYQPGAYRIVAPKTTSKNGQTVSGAQVLFVWRSFFTFGAASFWTVFDPFFTIVPKVAMAVMDDPMAAKVIGDIWSLVFGLWSSVFGLRSLVFGLWFLGLLSLVPAQICSSSSS